MYNVFYTITTRTAITIFEEETIALMTYARTHSHTHAGAIRLEKYDRTFRSVVHEPPQDLDTIALR